MGQWAVDNFLKFMQRKNIDQDTVNVTFLGYTFKENCRDTRNTKVRDLIFAIKNLNINVSLWDPLLNEHDIKDLRSEGIEVYESEPKSMQLAFLCVSHDEIITYLESYNGIIYDYKKIET
jgi:UDP-N-acetyl-D-galactosamine dehydrogenase